MRFLGGAVLVAATVLVLTGCGSQATQPTRTASVTTAPTPSATPTLTATATPTATPSSTVRTTATPEPTTTAAQSDPNRPANQCTDIGVSIVAADGGGGAGNEYDNVLFTNTGGTACALRGTPGVSVVDGNGTRIGKAADRTESGVTTLTLQAGDTVAAPLKVVNIGTDGGPLDGCTVQKGAGYRVYPPHSKKSYFVKDPNAVACVTGPSFMSVSPVTQRTD